MGANVSGKGRTDRSYRGGLVKCKTASNPTEGKKTKSTGSVAELVEWLPGAALVHKHKHHGVL